VKILLVVSYEGKNMVFIILVFWVGKFIISVKVNCMSAFNNRLGVCITL